MPYQAVIVYKLPIAPFEVNFALAGQLAWACRIGMSITTLVAMGGSGGST
jgi:hypothetical protein